MRFSQFSHIVLLCFRIFGSIGLRCSTPRSSYLGFGGKRVVLMLDSLTAAQSIGKDRTDNYFNLITMADMSIQMKRPLRATDTRESMMPEYMAFLCGDVTGFDSIKKRILSQKP